MSIEITITIEEGERLPPAVRDWIYGKLSDDSDQWAEQTRQDAAEVDTEDTKSFEEILDELPSDEHRYVFRAVVQKRGRARRVIHRKASELEGSPFSEFDPDNAGSERRQIGEILWDLQSRGYTYHEGNRWYPESEKFTESAMATNW
jgi:hypothetical protein